MSKYIDWTLIPWDGNPELGYECYRKTFGRGYVSVGAGNFLSITHSFGANSDNSFSDTRWRPDAVETAKAAMDRINTYYKEKHHG